MKDSRDNEAGFEIAMARYSEKWNNVKNAPYIPNDLYFSSNTKQTVKLTPNKNPKIPARIAI